MEKKKIAPMTVQELIDFLNTVENKKAVVGLACDSEGNGFTLMPNDQFWLPGYMENRFGYADFNDEPFEGAVPAIVLWGTN